MDKFEELEKIQALKDNGAITDKEFDTEKQKILNGDNIQNKTEDKAKTKSGIKVKKRTIKIIVAIIVTIAVVALGILLTQIITTEINIKQTEDKLGEINAEELETKLIEELKNTKLNINDLKIKTAFGKMDSINNDKYVENYGIYIELIGEEYLKEFTHIYITNGKSSIMLPLFKITSDSNGKFKNIEYTDTFFGRYIIEETVVKFFKDSYDIEIFASSDFNNFNNKYNERFHLINKNNKSMIYIGNSEEFFKTIVNEVSGKTHISDFDREYTTTTFGLDF